MVAVAASCCALCTVCWVGRNANITSTRVLQYSEYSFPCRNHKGHCPGETGSLWLSFSLQERARNRLCRYSIVCIQSHCDVLSHIMHKVTFTSPLMFHTLFETFVPLYLPLCLPLYLPMYLPMYLPLYLPLYHSTGQKH